MEKIIVRVAGNNPERGTYKTLYIKRVLREYCGIDCVKYRGHLWAISQHKSILYIIR